MVLALTGHSLAIALIQDELFDGQNFRDYGLPVYHRQEVNSARSSTAYGCACIIKKLKYDTSVFAHRLKTIMQP